MRKLATSNNFVLQAATRCLRQVPGNSQPARVYLTASNKKTLEDQLTETYGTSLKALDSQQAERVERTISLHKPHLPALLIKKRLLRIQRKAGAADVLLESYTPMLDGYTAAARLAALRHAYSENSLQPPQNVRQALQIPEHHLSALGQQLEAQHTYTPDFVLRRSDGKHLVVEVKSDKFSPDIAADMSRHAKGEAAQTLEGRKAVALKRWEQLNPDRLSYHVMFADTALHDAGKKVVQDFICLP